MMAELRRDGMQKDPIIVDRARGVVLDGMHRLSAFRALGIARSVCDLVDYDSPSITVGRWLRVYRFRKGTGRLEGMAEAGLGKRCPKNEGLESLKKGEVPVAAFVDDYALLPPSDGSIGYGFEIVRRFDLLAERRGWERSFAGEEQLEAHFMAGNEIVVVVKKLGKSDVLKAAMERRPFPCKTSMHVVDPRPVGVNFPLSELTRSSNESISGRLKSREFRILQPNTLYEGRRYKERLMLLGSE